MRSTTASLAIPSFVLTYSLASRTVSLHRGDQPPITLDLGETTFWDWFSDGQATLAAHLPPQVVRGGWRGGWVGWFGYEMKEESLAGYRRRPKAGNDAGEQVEEVDACWAWVPSMAQRTGDGEWLARAVLGNVSALPASGSPEAEAEADMISWLVSRGIKFGASVREYDELVTSLSTILSSSQPSQVVPAPAFPTFRPIATGDDYRGRIDSCREAIRQGESYELTLTTRFESQLCSSSSTRRIDADADADATATATASDSIADPYELYLRLRTFNPAYYSAWMSFPSLSTPRGHGVHVLSSSPERFLRIEGGQVEMMPIKGTMARVKPGQCVCTPGTGCGGLAKGSEKCAEEGRKEDERRGRELQNDPKERAENLMASTRLTSSSLHLHLQIFLVQGVSSTQANHTPCRSSISSAPTCCRAAPRLPSRSRSSSRWSHTACTIS